MAASAPKSRRKPAKARSRARRGLGLAGASVFATTGILGAYVGYPGLRRATAATSCTVTSNGDNDTAPYTSGELRFCLDQVNTAGGGTITFDANIGGTIYLNADLPLVTLTSSLTITGAGRADTVINGYGYRVFNVTGDDISISSLTIQYAYSSSGNGAAVTSSGNVTVVDSTFSDNNAKAGAGAAIFVSGDNSVTVSGSTFTRNTAKDSGGAIYADQRNSGSISITNSSFTDNAAGVDLVNPQSDHGGAVYSAWGDITIANSDFSSNEATSRGGAVAARNNGGTVTIREGSTFTGNKATSSSFASHGGAVFAYSGLTVEESTFTQNVVADLGRTGTGGALYTYYGPLLVSDSTFDRNQSRNDGGAIEAKNTLNQQSSISRSTFVSNEAVLGYGGAVFIGYGPLNVENSTFTGNRSGDHGSAIYGYEGDADIVLDFCTITSNTSGSTGAFAAAVVTGSNYTEDLSVTNSILYNNVDNNGDERDLSAGGNLSVSSSLLTSATSFYAAGTVTDSDLLYGDPLLGSLANNGGPTQTMLPAADSPVIGMANPTGAPATDQRGFSRTTGGLADMGSVERGGTAPEPDLSQMPPAWFQAQQRKEQSAVCPPGMVASWAEWPNEGTGGWTCEWSTWWDVNKGTAGGWVTTPGFNPGLRVSD